MYAGPSEEKMNNIDLIIIGAGPAGMAAALAAYEKGIKDILILERNGFLGGILGQCIHNGFGLHKFKKELTGPEYSALYEEKIKKYNIDYKLNTMVIDLSKDKKVTYINQEEGIVQLQAKAVILAMGCRERSRGALNICGYRPSGIYTAGTAQKFVNIKGYLPGKEVVILGSGDIGLIMARRMTLEGAKVKCVCEIMHYSGGLNRNIVQCLNDFDIPLMLEHTVIKIHGKDRLEGVTIAPVDKNRKPVLKKQKYISCDCLLLSVGLIPENELAKKADILQDNITGGAIVDQDRQTNTEGVFECGNALHVHDLVDYVSEEAEIAGVSAAEYIKGNKKKKKLTNIILGNFIKYIVPQKINIIEDKDIKLFFRVQNTAENVKFVLREEQNIVISKKKAKVAPGEMEFIIINKSALRILSGKSLILERVD